MGAAQIIGYGVQFDAGGRVLLLRRRAAAPPWAGAWWLPGSVTPRDEEPDETVPRVFASLLRQRATVGYLETVSGPDPQSGRHTVHNGYRVLSCKALEGQPEDERNEFDAAEWHEPAAALAVLPAEQGALLRAAIEQAELGIEPEPIAPLDDLFDEGAEPAAHGLSGRERALLDLALKLGAGTGDPAAACREASAAGLSGADVEFAVRRAAALGAMRTMSGSDETGDRR